MSEITYRVSSLPTQRIRVHNYGSKPRPGVDFDRHGQAIAQLAQGFEFTVESESLWWSRTGDPQDAMMRHAANEVITSYRDSLQANDRETIEGSNFFLSGITCAPIEPTG